MDNIEIYVRGKIKQVYWKKWNKTHLLPKSLTYHQMEHRYNVLEKKVDFRVETADLVIWFNAQAGMLMDNCSIPEAFEFFSDGSEDWQIVAGAIHDMLYIKKRLGVQKSATIFRQVLLHYIRQNYKGWKRIKYSMKARTMALCVRGSIASHNYQLITDIDNYNSKLVKIKVREKGRDTID